ncbi:hypothetical protein WJX81_006102 [Elliptochloris bilobata]|uniref:Type I phosphodiesterase/nucleotide pyrophosphatase n=1 Tax=Elliptochloris bilobata TaxID=381761 RepID=A0AAW1R0B3_9CHLO
MTAWAVRAALFLLIAAAGALAKGIEHVLLISVDGMHQVDLDKFVTAHPDSYMAKLVAKGVTYPNTHILPPSDSFPGLLSLVTGATAKTTGVYYDDAYSRILSPRGDLACKQIGAEIIMDESIEVDDTTLFSGISVDNLPRDPAKNCAPFFPHSYPKVNTIFEVLRAAGKTTAWCDKHWAYDLVNGPSGNGVVDLFTPEVIAVTPPDDFELVFGNDMLKVQAVLNQIGGRDSNNTKNQPVPTIMGLDFQTLSVAQKKWGYLDAAGTPTPQVLQALQDVDAALGSFMARMKSAGIAGKSAIILSAKHGQSPIDRTTLNKIPSSKLSAAIAAVAPNEPAQLTTDDVALIWLKDSSNAPKIAAALQASNGLGVSKVLFGAALNAQFGGVADRIPDIIVIVTPGVIYTGAAKIMEHGGFGEDDTHVPIVVYAPFVKGGVVVSDAVATTQVAPTILTLLDQDPNALQGVVAEGTKVLPGIHFDLHGLGATLEDVLSFGAQAPVSAPASAPSSAQAPVPKP